MIRTLLLSGIALLAACGSEPADTPEPTLRIAFDGAPRSVDPARASSTYASALVLASYETLFEYAWLARPMRLVPQLADGWPEVSDDGLTVIVRLRRDARFAPDPAFPDGQGRDLTARDVAYSILRQFLPGSRGQGGWLWRDRLVGLANWAGPLERPPAGIEVLDAHTLKFRLTAPSPQFLHTLATAYSAVVPPEADHYYGEAFGQTSVGSGPYQVIALDSARAVLVANPEYREAHLDLQQIGFDPAVHDPRLAALAGERLPMMPRIEVEFISDPASRWISFDKGDEIQITPVSSELIKPMLSADRAHFVGEAGERFRLHRYMSPETIMFRFDMSDPAIGLSPDPQVDARHRKLRCAIASAVSWESRNQSFYAGNAQLYGGIIPPMLPEFDPDRAPASDRQAAARWFAELAEAGPLPELGYAFEAGVGGQQNFEHFRAQLSAAGFPADRVKAVTYATFGDFLKGIYDGRNGIFLMQWGMDYADSENLLQLFYGPNARPGSNWGNYRNARYDALFEQVANLLPSAQRSELVSQMMDLLDADCAYSGSVTRRRFVASHAEVVGHPEASVMVNGRYFRFISVQPPSP